MSQQVKAEGAKATQTVTAHYPGGDYYSRKDMTEHDTAHGGPNGVAYTRQEQEWAKKAHRRPWIKEHQNNR
jgi:hypothetical protein